ncbi:MAG: hypothetical protein IPF90_03730 [Actinomycetales bacterium]|nr:hypothetical protein [Candidatus Phosphoribacter baldrii]
MLAAAVAAISAWMLAWFTTQILTSPGFSLGFDPSAVSAGFAANTAAGFAANTAASSVAGTAAGMVLAVLGAVLVTLAREARRQLVIGDPRSQTVPVRARARTAYEQAPSPSDPDAPGVARPRAPGGLHG